MNTYIDPETGKDTGIIIDNVDYGECKSKSLKKELQEWGFVRPKLQKTLVDGEDRIEGFENLIITKDKVIFNTIRDNYKNKK